MATDISVPQRYEFKYTISESMADAIRKYIQPIFSLDSHACPEQRGYIVNNVYMDTPGLRFYHDTKFHALTRFKPRVRYYGPQLGQFAILEVKHRHDTTTWKQRQRIDIHEWPGVLDVARSARVSPSHMAAPDTFADVNHLYSTIPVLHVRYFREPYVSDIDDYGRITFDQALRYRLARDSYDIASSDQEMIYYDDPLTTKWHESPIVLEIKTGTFVPFWAIDIVQRFSLAQRGYSKYCYVIDRCLENGYNTADFVM